MQIVIDIDEDVYARLFKHDVVCLGDGIVIENAVRNGTPIPDNATNKDVIKTIFPNEIVTHNADLIWYGDLFMCNDKWWNAPYQKGGKE